MDTGFDIINIWDFSDLVYREIEFFPVYMRPQEGSYTSVCLRSDVFHMGAPIISIIL